MQFGLALPNYRHVASPGFLQRFAQRAEALGYDGLWAADHVVVPEDVAQQFGVTFYDPFTTLAYIAALTERIRIGISAVVLPYRNPVHQAKMMATLDVLSGGRTTFAVAVGWSEQEMAVLGVPFARRGALADEYLQLFRELWTNPAPVFQGETVRLQGVVFAPRPVQDPLPLWGAGNSRAAIRRAARFCQGWHPRRRTPDELRDGVQYLRQEAERFERDPNAFDIALRLPLKFVEDRGLGATGLIGTPREIIDTIARYRAAGVTAFVLDTFGSPDLSDQGPDEIMATIERFASEVRPQLEALV